MTILVGLLPVVLFLAALVALDSYKLVRISRLAGAMLAGASLTALCWAVHRLVASWEVVPSVGYSRYVAPLVEEALKATVVLLAARAHRIGFLVDAAIYGFAVGTGFAVAENLYYWTTLEHASLSLWVVRGFGTAILHGSATAICALAGKSLSDRGGAASRWGWGIGFAIAASVHSLYNHFFVSPVVSTAGIVLLLPPLVWAVFDRSEKALERWLNVGFDADTEMLELLRAGRLTETPVGRYLRSIREHFRPEILVDLCCYLQLHLELSLRAKGLLLMREAGFEAPATDEDRSKLAELAFLERSIGPTGRLAMAPFLRGGSRDRWQLELLR